MNELDITNIGTWIHDFMQGKVVRYNVYKKVFTPYELDKKYSDESEFENGGYYEFGIMTNAIEIPNDVLIEFSTLYDEGEYFRTSGRKEYHKLSDIKLVVFEEDEGKEVLDEDI